MTMTVRMKRGRRRWTKEEGRRNISVVTACEIKILMERREDTTLEMTAIKKDDTVDVTEKASPKMSSTLQQSCTFGTRHLQALLLFLGMTIGYSLRVSMSVAIVAMTDAKTANPGIEDYDWDNVEKNMVLSSFFWGYVIMQVPSGYIAGIWSGQKLLSIGMLVCGVFNLVTPVAARLGLEAVVVCRIGMGLTQACLLPCVQTLLSKWVPPSERARLGTFTYAGAQFGTVITMPVSGVLATSSKGWPSIFYVFGTLTIVWSVLYFYFGADSPAKHRSISEKERQYIEESLKTTKMEDENEIQQRLRVPWKEICTSKPMWALLIVHCGQNWGYWTLLTEMPSYMTGVMKDIEKSGVFSALPYLAMWILSFPISWLSDYALKKGASRGTVRKTCNTIAHWGPAIALACMSLVPTDNYTWAVVILTVAVGLNAGSLCGYQINHIDLSPNFAGTMMSITNCIATITAIIAPLICGMIVTDESNVHQWNIVFNVSAAIFFVGNLIFVIFGTGEIQWWNDLEEVQRRKRNGGNKKEDKSQIST